jgi:hypothetical protein
MAKHASSSNFLTEEPICRTFPITRRQHVQHKSHGFDDVFEKSPQYYPAKQIVPPNSSKSELNRATWHRHQRASPSTRATLHRSAVYALPTCLDIKIGFISLSRCMISILLWAVAGQIQSAPYLTYSCLNKVEGRQELATDSLLY